MESREREENARYLPALQPELVLAAQKDSFFASQLAEQLAWLFESACGAQSLSQWSAELQFAANLAYLSLTSLRPRGAMNRTLGQEYADIMPVSAMPASGQRTGTNAGAGLPSSTTAPSLDAPAGRKRRGLAIAIQVLAPLVFARLTAASRFGTAAGAGLGHGMSGAQQQQAAVRQRLLRERARRRRQQSGQYQGRPPSAASSGAERLAAAWARLQGKVNNARSAAIARYQSFWVVLYAHLQRVQQLVASVPIVSRVLHNAPVGSLLSTSSQLHLVAFYLWGRYYEIHKRVAGIRLVSLAGSEGRPNRLSYRVLGQLLLLQLGVGAGIHAWRLWKHDDEEGRSAGSDDAFASISGLDSNSVLSAGGVEVPTRGTQQNEETSSASCMLCLSPVDDPAAPPCGHVFCWECIIGWLQRKEECPVCRQAALPQQVLCLYRLG